MSAELPQIDSFFDAIERLLDVKTDDPVQVRRGRLVNLVLLVTLSVTLVMFVLALLTVLFVSQGGVDISALWRIVFFGVVLGAAYGLNKNVASPLVGVVFALAVLSINMVALGARGPFTPAVIGLILPVLIAGLLGWPGSAFALASLAVVGYGWVNVRSNPSYFADMLRGGPETATLIVYFNLFLVATLVWLFARMAGRAIRESHGQLEELLMRQRGLAAQLDRQRGGLRAAANVARALIGSRNQDALLKNSVKLIREQFGGTLHVEIYLADESGESVILRESAGGKVFRMLAKGDRVPVGSLSVVGRAADGAIPVMGGDVSEVIGPRSPQAARSGHTEVAAPLVMNSRLIGVLRLRTDDASGFDSSILPSIQSLADQMAVAIENARIYEETQSNLRELGVMSRIMTRRGWKEFLRSRERGEVRFQFGPADETRNERQEIVVQRVMEMGTLVAASTQGADNPGYLAVPMRLRDELIGVIGVEVDDKRRWSQDDVAILQSLAERAAVAVENARLFEQANRSALRQEMVNEITQKLQGAPDLQLLLEGVVSELKDALGVDQVYAEFAVKPLPVSDEKPMAVEGDAADAAVGAVVVNGAKPEPEGSADEEQPREEAEVEGEDSRREVT